MSFSVCFSISKKGFRQKPESFLYTRKKSALAELRSAAGCFETVLLKVSWAKALVISGFLGVHF